MALIDRVFRDNPDPDYAGYITNHSFSGAVWFWAKGDFTRAQLVASFGFDASDDAQLDDLQTHYISLSATDRLAFHSDLEAASALAEQGRITRTQYKVLLGMT